MEERRAVWLRREGMGAFAPVIVSQSARSHTQYDTSDASPPLFLLLQPVCWSQSAPPEPLMLSSKWTRWPELHWQNIPFCRPPQPPVKLYQPPCCLPSRMGLHEALADVQCEVGSLCFCAYISPECFSPYFPPVNIHDAIVKMKLSFTL